MQVEINAHEVEDLCGSKFQLLEIDHEAQLGLQSDQEFAPAWSGHLPATCPGIERETVKQIF